MTQTVDVIDSPATSTWSHPYSGLPLTLDLVGCIGAGGGSGVVGGGGGACNINTAASIVTGDVNIQVGTGGADGSTDGGYTVWDTDFGASYVKAYGGSCTDNGSTGGPGSSGGGTFTIARNGGSGTDTGGGGAAGANADGSDGTTSGGAGGSNGTYPAALQGGAGGNAGVAGHAPGGGGGSSHAGADGRLVVAYTLVDASVSGDFGTGSTGSISIPSGQSIVGNVTPAGNPVPSLEVLLTGDGGLFDFADNGDGSFGLEFTSTPTDGTYVVSIQASGSTDFIQTVTVTVGSSPSFNPWYALNPPRLVT